MLQTLEIIERTKELKLQKYDTGGSTVHEEAWVVLGGRQSMVGSLEGSSQ